MTTPTAIRCLMPSWWLTLTEQPPGGHQTANHRRVCHRHRLGRAKSARSDWEVSTYRRCSVVLDN